MNRYRSLIVTSLIAVLLACGGLINSVSAQGWYGGVSFGDASTSASGFDDSSPTTLYIGNRISNTAAVEFAYVDLDEFDVEGFSDAYIEISGFEVSALGLAQIGESSSIYGKVGLYIWDLDAVAFGVDVGEEDGTSLLFGLGLDIPIGETIGARLERVNYLDIEDEDVDTLNLGLYANF